MFIWSACWALCVDDLDWQTNQNAESVVSHPPHKLSCFLLVCRHVDAEALATELAAPRDQRLTPKMFMHQIMQQCLEQPQNIVLPEVASPSIVLPF